MNSMTKRGPVTWLGRAAMLGCASTLLYCGTFPEDPSKQYALRIVPERDAVGANGGPVFVQIELAAPESPFSVHIASYGSNLDPAPALSVCRPQSSDASVAAESGSSRQDAGDTNVGSSATAVVAVTKAAFSCIGGECKAGFVLSIPKGSQDTLLVATLAKVEDSNPCGNIETLGIATARIRRSSGTESSDASAEASADDGGATDSAADAISKDAATDRDSDSSTTDAQPTDAQPTDAQPADAQLDATSDAGSDN